MTRVGKLAAASVLLTTVAFAQEASKALDPGSNATGLTLTPAFIESIPLLQPGASGLRSFEALSNAAPQVVSDRYGFGFSGAQSPENLYLLDGVSTNDPAFGINRGQLPVEFLERATILTGGAGAEYGHGTGGVVSVTTRSGTNEFRGEVWGTLTPGALTGTARELHSDDSMVVQQSRLWNTGDFGALVSGPIIKDRLWFATGVAFGFVRTQDTRSLRRFLINASGSDFKYDQDNVIASAMIPGTTVNRFDDTRTFSYFGKLTFQAAEGHLLTLSVVETPSGTTVPFGFGSHLGTSWNGGTVSHDDTTTASLSYSGRVLPGLTVDASLGWFHVSEGTAPNDGSTPGTSDRLSAAGAPLVIFRRNVPHSILDFESIPDPSRCESAGTGATAGTTPALVFTPEGERYLMACPATGNGQTSTIGGMGFIGSNQLDRLQAKASATYLLEALGHHVWKAGVDVERDSDDASKAYSGGVVLRESGTGSSFSDYRQYGFLSGPDTAVTQLSLRSVTSSTLIGAYLQDSWAILDRVTLNAGLRYDTQQLFANDGRLAMTLNNELSPRVGLTWDPTGQGRSKLFASYARYHEAIPLDLADRGLSGESQVGATHRPCNPLADFNQVFAQCRVPDVRGSTFTGQAPATVDPQLQGQSSGEVLVGGQYELIPQGVLAASYTRRWLERIVEDMSIDEGQSTVLGNPGAGLGSSFPPAVRDYDSISASFSKAFSDGWQAQASYTWSYLRGNYDGLFRPYTGQLDPNGSSDFDLLSLLTNRTGPLDANRTHAVKVFASKEFDFASGIGVQVGLSYDGHSGSPISYLGAHAFYGPGESFVLPRGSGGSLPWQHSVNARAAVSYKLTATMRVQLSVDVFNVFNFAGVTAVDQNLTSSAVQPVQVTPGTNGQQQVCLAGAVTGNCAGGSTGLVHPDGSPLWSDELNPNFKRATAYQAPISARLGARLSF